MLFIPLIFLKSKQKSLRFKSNFKFLLLVGLFAGLSTIFHMLGISLANVVYIFALRRTDMLFSAIFGVVLFGETGMKQRIPAILLMFAGIVLMGIF